MRLREGDVKRLPLMAKTTRKPAKRAALNREKVLLAAIRLADDRGIDALTMRELARLLKVEAMSLYNHVASKDDCLDGMVDIVIGEVEIPKGVGWREALRRRAISAHEMMLRHRWAAALIMSRINVGPNMLHYIDDTLGVLKTAGFSYAKADSIWNALDGYIYGFTALKQNFPVNESEYASAAKAFIHMLPAETYPHMRTLADKVISGEHSGVVEFEFGLNLFINGLDRLLKGG